MRKVELSAVTMTSLNSREMFWENKPYRGSYVTYVALYRDQHPCIIIKD